MLSEGILITQNGYLKFCSNGNYSNQIHDRFISNRMGAIEAFGNAHSCFSKAKPKLHVNLIGKITELYTFETCPFRFKLN